MGRQTICWRGTIKHGNLKVTLYLVLNYVRHNRRNVSAKSHLELCASNKHTDCMTTKGM